MGWVPLYNYYQLRKRYMIEARRPIMTERPFSGFSGRKKALFSPFDRRLFRLLAPESCSGPGRRLTRRTRLGFRVGSVSESSGVVARISGSFCSGEIGREGLRCCVLLVGRLVRRSGTPLWGVGCRVKG